MRRLWVSALRAYLLPAAFLTLVPLAAHLAFSRLGFVPANDDGFILACSRRLLDGQIPHRDFISIRPVGSGFVHLPFVLLGGDYTFLLSRLFVWFQFACIAWAWISILSRLTEHTFRPFERVILGLFAFLLSSQIFPIMAWHTIDCLFFVSIGLYLTMRPSRTGQLAGWVLLGMSVVCKQNFLFVVVAALILTGSWRRPLHWLVCLIPGAVYVGYLGLHGALGAAAAQLGSQGGKFLPYGLLTFIQYRRIELVIGLAAGGTAALLRSGRLSIMGHPAWSSAIRTAGTLLLVGLPTAVLVVLVKDMVWLPSFILFGAVAGLTVYSAFDPDVRSELLRAGLLVLSVAWCTAVSIGYTTPALANGPMGLLLLIAASRMGSAGDGRGATRTPGAGADSRGFAVQTQPPGRVWTMVAGLALLVGLLGWSVARVRHVWCEPSADQLTYRLDGVFPGANGIRTDAATFAFLSDLKATVGSLGGRRFITIPNLAGYWAKAPQPNPLSIDWPSYIELDGPRLVERVQGDIGRLHGSVVVLIQKAGTWTPTGLQDLGNDHTPVVEYVRTHFRKSGETAFFEVFE